MCLMIVKNDDTYRTVKKVVHGLIYKHFKDYDYCSFNYFGSV